MPEPMTLFDPSLIAPPTFALGFSFLALIITALAIWTIVWKGIALWYAARGGEKIWFIVFLIVNTAGILEIIYIFFLRKNRRQSVSSAPVQ
jgi:methionyl-tRNA synthetase